jgi:glycosyltransferase involved in cell wall biosynthesis
MPSYNLGRFVVDSVASVLRQTMDDLECIVVDDGSTDDTLVRLAAIPDPRLRLVRKENRGTVADTRNRGIAEATGELVAFLDADDWWFAHKLERQVALLEQRPDTGLVYSAYAIADETMQILTAVWPDVTQGGLRRQVLLEAHGIGFGSTAVVPARVLAEVGDFNLELSVSEDIDLADRIAQRFRVDAVDECLVLYRNHGGQGHRRLDRYEHDMLWLIDDRFGPEGSRDRASWARARGNLHTRLAISAARRREPDRLWRNLRLAVSTKPSRMVALPIDAVRRRAERRWRFRSERDELGRRYIAEQAQVLPVRGSGGGSPD